MVPDNNYSEIVKIIQSARERAFYKVNEELIGMYMQIGKFVSENSREAAYGDNYVDGLAKLSRAERFHPPRTLSHAAILRVLRRG